MKRPLVFTNGCFDVLHRGHVELLREASLMGETLVVAVNSDRSVRELKGEGRPVNTAEDRAAVLRALRFVDEVIVFDGEYRLQQLLQELHPDVYVKGEDWQEKMPFWTHGLTVQFVPHRYKLSTTKTLDALGPLVP